MFFLSPKNSSCAFLFLLASVASAAPATEGKIEFNRDVRPILSDNCFTCHGQDSGARKAKLRLDDRAAALVGGKSEMPAIVPGKPDESELILRVTAEHDSEDLMPTPKSKKSPLTPVQIATLRAWIAQGAEYQPHWAFIPPVRPAVPEITVAKTAAVSKPASSGSRKKPKTAPPAPVPPAVNPIDAFVAARLTSAGLKPSPPADPATLGRRVWLDLVGLPPSTAELDEFLAAYAKNGDAAYRTLVDTLLASPRYGEKWARHWLDVARYADSDGYEKDLPRQQWAWRDWVINSLNEDKPYDRFIVEQIAGDLLAQKEPDALKAQALLVATGYIRNSMVSEEGAIITEQYRMEGMVDRMDAIGKGVLGLTMQCAQCHTHKFDPITHDDYYRTLAFLNNTYEATSRVYGPEKMAVIERVRSGLADIDTRVKTAHPDWAARIAAWSELQNSGAVAWETVTPVEPVWGGGLVHPEVLPDGSVISLGYRPSYGELSFTATPKLNGITGLRLEALNYGDLIFGGPGRSIEGLFAVSELTVEAIPPGETKGKPIALINASADFESASRAIDKPFSKIDDENRILGPAAYLIDGKDETAWSPDRGVGRRNAPTEIVVQFKEPLIAVEGTKLNFILRFRHGGKDPEGSQNQHLGRVRVALTTAPAPVAAKISTAARLALAIPPATRTPAQQSAIFTAWRASVPELAEINASAERLWTEFPVADTTVLHIAERSVEDTRGTFRLDRGAWDKPKEKLAAGTPGFLHPLTPDSEAPRLAFARWLVDPRSPTTSRAAVNRVWQSLFGAGLVDSPEDFGVRAAQPVQPEVLDWLAVEFMERGWSQKQLIRTIVTSATYRQSSRVTPELLELDPRNRLLARGPRFRVDAEVVRDIALQTSGLLNEKLGGPSFYPVVPKSFLALSYAAIEFWVPATGPERYRRSLYVFRRRSMPDPVLTSFDAPTGENACVRREHSNTPLAALASLNEPLFVEASQALALRVLREGGADDKARAAFAFRLCTARPAQPAEIDDILALLKSRRTRLTDGWLSARTLAFGETEKLPSLPPGTTPNDAAAWTIAARVLLNLDETLTKN